MPLSPDLLMILACPQCKGVLELVPDNSGLACRVCRLKFPIHDDIPLMLVEEAIPFGEE